MKTVLVFSGGVDSTTLLYRLQDQGDEVKAIGFDYGQRHRVELEHATKIAAIAKVPYEIIDISSIASAIAGKSSQLNPDVPVPVGTYTAENMHATVVPNRNMIMLSIAIGHAVSLEFDAVAYAAHGGDHAIYPDCRPEFVEGLDRLAAVCDWHPVKLVAPFVRMTKTDIIRVGSELGIPFEMTWSCYQGGTTHCGQCGTCRERRESFAAAKIIDPTRYETTEPSPSH